MNPALGLPLCRNFDSVILGATEKLFNQFFCRQLNERLTPNCRRLSRNVEGIATDKSKKLKKYHRENKILFGSLLETSTQKKKINKDEVEQGDLASNSKKDLENRWIINASGKTNVKKLNAKIISIKKNNHNKNSSEEKTAQGKTASDVGQNLWIASLKNYTYFNLDRVLDESSCDPVTTESSSIINLKYPEGGRNFPSVSKILDQTMPVSQREALIRWEKKMIEELGEKGFAVYKKGLLQNGKMLHASIDKYLRGTPIDMLNVPKEVANFWTSLQSFLPSIVSETKAIESFVTHKDLRYCGIVDCIASFRERLVMIDWKTSKKQKSGIASMYDAPLQLVAYIGAINHDPKYKELKIDDGLIVVAYEDGSDCQLFYLSPSEVKVYWNKWIKRLTTFYESKVSSLRNAS